MKAADRKKLKAELERKRKELIESTRLSREANRAPSEEGLLDLADRATESYQKEFLYSLTDTERAILRLVDAALERMEEGTYGQCESCEEEIALSRLKAIPWAALCITCQEEQEAAGGHRG